jgi:transposase
MPPANRHDPQRTLCSDSQFSLMEFMHEFPDDAACLEHLWRTKHANDGEHAHCPKCKQDRSFRRYATAQSRQSWTCTGCGHHLHPTAGTIFEGSSTSLKLWYYAMYLMASTRCGISAKQLEREIGVAYKTAWRMLNKIRNEIMVQDEAPLSGEVEVDETFIGGAPRAREIERYRLPTDWNRMQAASRWTADPANKATVLGMVERGGRVRAEVVPSRQAATLKGKVIAHVLPESTIFTDEWRPYVGLAGSFAGGHHRIRHKAHIYVNGNVHTNTIEGFFGNIKNGLRGTYHAVSQKWLQSYLNEYVWRYNERHNPQPMFVTMIERAAR